MDQVVEFIIILSIIKINKLVNIMIMFYTFSNKTKHWYDGRY